MQQIKVVFFLFSLSVIGYFPVHLPQGHLVICSICVRFVCVLCVCTICKPRCGLYGLQSIAFVGWQIRFCASFGPICHFAIWRAPLHRNVRKRNRSFMLISVTLHTHTHSHILPISLSLYLCLFIVLISLLVYVAPYLFVGRLSTQGITRQLRICLWQRNLTHKHLSISLPFSFPFFTTVSELVKP